MSNEYDLSVIILTYNSGDTMYGCLDSLVKQSRNDFKVIIVDDESSDNTIDIVNEFKQKQLLDILVVKNGSHNISKGRNIGLQASGTTFVAFIDSDAYAEKKWAASIISNLEKSDVVMLAGRVLPEYRNNLSRAIAYNDDTIREIFAKDVALFSGCNFALKRELFVDYKFDENFIHAEDIDYVKRVGKKFKWKVVNSMRVRHESRSTIRRYRNQMYKYGIWKIFYGYRFKSYRLIDFVPIIVATVSIPLSFWHPLFLITFPLFCIAETAFIILIRRPPINLFGMILLAWIIKNTAWSVGVLKAVYSLMSDQSLRHIVSTSNEKVIV